MVSKQRVAGSSNVLTDVSVSPLARSVRTAVQAALGVATAWIVKEAAKAGITLTQTEIISVGATVGWAAVQNILEHFGILRVLGGKAPRSVG